MSLFHILRVLVGTVLAGAIGWASLVGFNVIKIMQRLEAFQAAPPNSPNSDFGMLPSVLEEAVRNMEGGEALFLAAGIAGVLLGEIFRTRSLLFYAGATGALTAVFAAAFWQQANAPGNAHAAAALAMAGFVAGSVYWMIAGPPASHR
jgi:hypothetical protein